MSIERYGRVGQLAIFKQLASVRLTGAASGRLFLLCAMTMILSLLLGGATRSGYLSDALLQLFSIPLLIVALSQLFEAPFERSLFRAFAFCAAVIVLPLLQLIPLPPWIWTHLPGRNLESEVFHLLGRDTNWMPISLSPDLTWQSAMSLIPPIGIFIGTVLLSYRERRLLSLVVLGFGLVSVAIGLLQVAQGETSPLRFFQITNPSEAVGFFANRNHFAALLYALTLFAAAWVMQSASTAKAWWGQKNYHAADIIPVVTSFIALVVLVAAQAMARSRAGLALTMVALVAIFALIYVNRSRESRGKIRKIVAGSVLLAMAFAVQFALYRVLERFDADPLQDARIPIARTTLAGAASLLPFGAGMGTFVPVYGMYEKSKDATGEYINHAHNDVLEVLLEAGVPGLLLIGLLITGFCYQSAKLWRRESQQREEVDLALARSASIVIALIMLHSLVDYPLRTAAMMSILAFSCAFLFDSPVKEKPRREVAVTPAKAKVMTVIEKPLTIARSFETPRSIDWPDEWKKESTQANASQSRIPDSEQT